MERFIRAKEVAAMLGTSPNVAISILKEHGVYPVNFGRGGYRGWHWLESAVSNVILEMHVAAQPKPKQSSPKIKKTYVSLANLSTNELYELTRKPKIQ